MVKNNFLDTRKDVKEKGGRVRDYDKYNFQKKI